MILKKIIRVNIRLPLHLNVTALHDPGVIIINDEMYTPINISAIINLYQDCSS